MKITTLILVFFISISSSYAQQFGLYNSKTLYDAFENPSQSAYQVDDSRRIAFNFFIPTLTFNMTTNGSAELTSKSLIYDGIFSKSLIPIGQKESNTATLYTNTYIAMLRLLATADKSQEIGVSWQIRNDGRAKVTEEIDPSTGNPNGVFNSERDNQSYHQFSLTYRQDYNDRLSLGIKGSLLSGISYTSSDVVRRPDNSITGGLKSSSEFNKAYSHDFYPFFKNPGLSFTAGAGLKFQNGWFVMGNLKDIGFIKWSKGSYVYNLNVTDASTLAVDGELTENELKSNSSHIQKSYLSALNGKAEILLNKDLGNYQPNLILSKSLFYDGGDIVLTNNYHYRNLVFTASADYSTNKFYSTGKHLAIGGQFMIKSPNTEFFIGSDNLFQTFETIGKINNETPPHSAVLRTGASVYMGFGLKFGSVRGHPANSNNIPGFGSDPDGGFLKRLFRKKG